MSDFIICWSCKSQSTPTSFFCSKCNIVQPLAGLSPFEILDIKKSFDLDDKFVETQYFERQNRLHPDRFATKTPKEKMYASQQAMAINDAYNLIKAPIDRADFLCVALGGASYKDENKKNISQDILMSSMMQREALSQATNETILKDMLKNNQDKQNKIINNISLFYKEKNIEQMEKSILNLQYENRFMQEIKVKLAKIKRGDTPTSMVSPL